jgi:hypothetical protein
LHARVKGRDRLLLSPLLRYVQDDELVVEVLHDSVARVQVFPCDDLEGARGAGHFLGIDVGTVRRPLPAVEIEPLRDNTQAPLLRMGPFVAWRQRAVPLAPDDASYDTATRVRLHLPAAIPCDQGRVLLAIDYVGDTARLYADDVFVDDHFYDGETWWVGVDRFARDGRWPRLEVAIVAARDDLPIFLEAPGWQRLRASTVPAAVTAVSVQWWRTHRVELPLAAA